MYLMRVSMRPITQSSLSFPFSAPLGTPSVASHVRASVEIDCHHRLFLNLALSLLMTGQFSVCSAKWTVYVTKIFQRNIRLEHVFSAFSCERNRFSSVGFAIHFRCCAR